MITHIEENPTLRRSNILTFELDGRVDKVSFIHTMRKVLSKMETSENVNLFVRVTSIEGVELDVIWESLKFAFTSLGEFLSQIDKVAFVTDKKWLAFAANLEDKLIPGIEEKVFSFEEEALAIEWLKGD